MVVGLILYYIGVIAIAILLGAFVFFTGLVYWNRRKYAHIPSIPISSFYFGHHKDFAECYVEGGDKTMDMLVHESYQKLDSTVFCFHFLHATWVSVLEPSAIKEIVLDRRHTRSKEAYRSFRAIFGTRFTGRGLLTEPDYDQWHKRRVILNNAFHNKFLKDFMSSFCASADLFVDKLSESADGKTEISMVKHLNRCTLDVIAKVAFNLDLGIIENENSFFNEATLQALDGMIKNGDLLFVMDFRNRKFKETTRRAVRTIREIGRECLSKRIDEMNSGKEVTEDILTYIIKGAQEVKEDDREKMEVMMDEFALFFVAGSETTANMLSFTILALGRHPEVLHRLKTEVDAVLGDKMCVDYEDIKKLEYMTQVLKESLRLWPPVSGLFRNLAFDVSVAGYEIPAGTNLIFNAYTLARMEKYFQNAEDFDPDRFKDETDMTKYTYFPFAFGPHSCIGQQLAMIEARVILSRFLQRFQFELVPGQKFTMMQRITAKPKEGCMVYLKDSQAQ